MLGLDLIFDSLAQFLLACVILAVAETVYVLLGFGAGLIAVGALALIMPELRDAVVVLLLVNLPAELYVVHSSWRHIQWRGVLALFVAVAVGIPIGAWLLRAGEPRFLLLILGGLLVTVGAVFLLQRTPRRLRLGRWSELPIGLISGLLTGLFGTGGPPLILYYQLRGVDKTVFRGNLMAIFLLMTAVRVPSYAALDLITAPRLWSAAAVMPAVLVGAFIGQRIHLSLAEDRFRRLVSVALLMIGCLLLIQGR
jgi:uncharacterized membrane protein YfcA